jgi:hypothetical protein
MNANGQREPNRLKRDLAAGKLCLGATITMNRPFLAKIMSHMGDDTDGAGRPQLPARDRGRPVGKSDRAHHALSSGSPATPQ